MYSHNYAGPILIGLLVVLAILLFFNNESMQNKSMGFRKSSEEQRMAKVYELNKSGEMEKYTDNVLEGNPDNVMITGNTMRNLTIEDNPRYEASNADKINYRTVLFLAPKDTSPGALWRYVEVNLGFPGEAKFH